MFAMSTPIPVERLDVIGYADPRSSGMLPCIVPPVFKLRDDPERILVPPYALNGGFACRASEIDSSKMQELLDQGELVLLDNPRPARMDFELWIDESNASHYQPRTEARNSLQQLAEQSVQHAAVAFQSGHLEDAERFCSSAISANDKYVEAFVLKAAIRRREGDLEGAWLMAKLVSPYLDESSFATLVSGHSPQNEVNPTPPDGARVPWMRDMATQRAVA
jgi:hypothetical protein